MEQFKALWAGRSRRREYWICVVALIAGYVLVAAIVGPVIASTLSLPFWALIGTRRLHDIETTGWFSLLPAGLAFVCSFIVSFCAAAGMPLPVNAVAVNLCVSLISMIFMIGLGVWPSRRRPSDNPAPEAAA